MGVVIWHGWGILAPCLYDVARSWRQDGSKIDDFRSCRRSWGHLGAKLGNIIFSKTRPEARETGKVGSAGSILARPAAEAWPGEGKGGENSHPSWTLEFDKFVLHGEAALDVLRRIEHASRDDRRSTI